MFSLGQRKEAAAMCVEFVFESTQITVLRSKPPNESCARLETSGGRRRLLVQTVWQRGYYYQPQAG